MTASMLAQTVSFAFAFACRKRQCALAVPHVWCPSSADPLLLFSSSIPLSLSYALSPLRSLPYVNLSDQLWVMICCPKFSTLNWSSWKLSHAPISFHFVVTEGISQLPTSRCPFPSPHLRSTLSTSFSHCQLSLAFVLTRPLPHQVGKFAELNFVNCSQILGIAITSWFYAGRKKKAGECGASKLFDTANAICKVHWEL